MLLLLLGLVGEADDNVVVTLLPAERRSTNWTRESDNQFFNHIIPDWAAQKIIM